MNKYIYGENNGLWYELQGDYYLPCLTLLPKEEKPIGIWGQRHKRYLQEHKKAFYTILLTSGRLNSYLADIDERDGATKGRKSTLMGTKNEQHSGVCSRSCRE